ncbi:MAG: FAD-dependent oxidoreductase [Thiobacillus sp.]|nr:FAD-dependent oxidoreductase [Thiobacillus sp.]
MTTKLDVIVIGAGSTGLAAVRQVKKKTDNFVLINDGPYGTTCARVGCMPSKALIEAANAFHARTMAEAFGIRGSERLSIDIPAVMQRVRALRDRFL